jgi:hypothetical protein
MVIPHDHDRELNYADDRRAQMHVDGELTDDAAASFQPRIDVSSVVSAHVEAHRNLKAAVARALEVEAPPEELRARIAKMLTGRGPEVVGRIGGLRARSETAVRRSWWEGPRRANAVAVAASLAFVAGAVLFGIFGPTIGQVSRHSAGIAMTDVAAHATGEHSRCSESDVQRAAKAPFRTAQMASAELSAHLGRAVPVIDLSGIGYEFCCAGFCAVPGAESHSGHIMYVKSGDDPGSQYWVSLFVAPADVSYYALDSFGRSIMLSPGEIFAESPANDSFRNPASRVYGWSDGSLVYFLRVSAEADASAVIGELTPLYRREMPNHRD